MSCCFYDNVDDTDVNCCYYLCIVASSQTEDYPKQCDC